jgi:glucokinase
MESKNKFIGIDLGGTNITAGIVTKDGEILNQASTKTNAHRSADEVIADIVAVAKKALKENGTDISEIKSIGVGSPGAIDDESGEVIFAGNLNWTHIPLKEKLEESLKIPAYVSNDANVAAYAEYLFGAGKGKKSVQLVTLGTGVGGGYVLDGKIQSGHHGVGMEIGHMILVPEGILCTCGNKGCLERYASASGIISMGREAMANAPNGSIAKEAKDNPQNVTAKLIIDLAKQGDVTSLNIFKDYARYLAYAVVNIINFNDPEVIIFGGGVSRAGDFLLDAIKEEVAPRVFCKQAPYSEILLSKMGNEAGVIGAALLGEQYN